MQLIYTVATMVPVRLLFMHMELHVGYILLMIFISIWNGANFYIEVTIGMRCLGFEGAGCGHSPSRLPESCNSMILPVVPT